MTEKYLHFLWKKKRVPAIGLTLTNGKPLEILHFGFYNSYQSGPDFSMGIIHLDGCDLFGPIEMHIRSSDWYHHKHDHDSNYDNVILHVVYENDRPVVQAGRLIPTLELKRFIDPLHYQLFISKQITCDSIQCKPNTNGFTDQLESMKAIALERKLTDKIDLVHRTTNSSLGQIYFKLAARSFGMGKNKEAFEELCASIPLSVIQGMSKNEIFQFIRERATFFNVEGNKRIRWELTGMRPGNKPSVRILQFAAFIAVSYSTDKPAGTYPSDLNSLTEKCEAANLIFRDRINPISKSFINHLMINLVIPFKYQLMVRDSAGDSLTTVVNVLKSLPAENNEFVRQWENRGAECISAYDSQSLLALNTYYCSEKKCLSCEVGKHYLNRVHDTENCILF